ncbi:MAG: transcriptional regulator [Rhodobacteraceae bacterium PARR1]|nr:MAG: transcriptional regulator [Rhodobacteraceae bacterium PARR1]
MPTSTRFAVATHILTALAITDGQPVRSEDIANSVNTGAVVIRGLLSRLAEAGLTRSQLGSGGGALLAKAPEEIRLLDVYRAVEDTELFAVHRQPPLAECLVGGNILQAIGPALMRAQEAMEAELGRTTIADVVIRLNAAARA